jgi:hypothetical protein
MQRGGLALSLGLALAVLATCGRAERLVVRNQSFEIK